jgi:hypothetical protein
MQLLEERKYNSRYDNDRRYRPSRFALGRRARGPGSKGLALDGKGLLGGERPSRSALGR